MVREKSVPTTATNNEKGNSINISDSLLQPPKNTSPKTGIFKIVPQLTKMGLSPKDKGEASFNSTQMLKQKSM